MQRWACGILAAGLLAAMVLQPGHADETHSEVLFYDPDANHQAILNITAWFNSYLRTAGTQSTFQPVQGRDAFERLLRQPDSTFAIVASAYLRDGPAVKLTPLLVPSAGGDVYYRKLLLDTGKGTAGMLAGRNIAATITGRNAAAAEESILASLARAGVDVRGAHLIPVSKDIDALLALSFGQVDAALVTPASLQVLKRINPAAVKSARVVLETKPILRSPLCAVAGHVTAAEQRSFVRAIKEMATDPQGRQAMQTMGFDRWVDYAAGMLK